ncbi:hypothetical protein PHMEG_00013458 [Phytophthora megakarya]|uniref:Reverse transcriptase n=1 Tax=Phytophthora megakarya TaxID=4795 RepID=A0A225W678_9STRA|nr:hypothetical protein PHMEG_00013458 [Phytophthora megakarya]
MAKTTENFWFWMLTSSHNGHLPFGAVEKADVDPNIEVRLIHDLSSPPGLSPNDNLDKNCLLDIDYEYITVLARRIEMLAANHPGHTIWILKSDVKGVFRHLMPHAKHEHWMARLVRERNGLVIDLVAPFGWSGSPKFYAVFGRAISWLVEQNSPASGDAHIMIEMDIENRLELAKRTLRHAMLAILAP